MADIVITPADVQGTDVRKITVIAGETIEAGDPVYHNEVGSNYLVSDADTEGKGQVNGIALNSASAGQPVVIARSGDIDLGAALTVGEVYVLSAEGGIAPVADLVAGMTVVVLGVATAADNLVLNIINSGAEVPA